MKRNNESFTLEENLVLTNDELLSNWTKFASLVKTYEDIPYDTAKKKALAMLDDETALSYLENVRKYPNGKPEIKAEVTEPQAEPKPSVTAKPKLPPEVTIYHKNYDRLIALAPGLEEKLSKVRGKGMDGVYGKSKKTGYMDFNLELIHVDKDSFYIALSHYFKQNGDMVADPDMVVRLDLQNRLIEALSFQNAFYYKEVYDDSYDRKMVDQSEKKSQNAFLTQWLKNLKIQGHKIVWIEPESTGIADSTLTIEYEKEREPAKKQAKIAEKPIEEEKHEKEPEIKAVVHPVSEFNSREMKKLVSAILYMDHKNDTANAELKADELRKNGNAGNYLLKVIDRMKASHIGDLFMSNFFKLMYVVPDLIEKIDSETSAHLTSGIFKTDAKYDIGYAADVPTIRQFAIYDKTDSSSSGVLMIKVRPVQKTAWVEIFSGGFYGQEDYFDEPKSSTSQRRYEANKAFNLWLDFLIGREYKTAWDDKEIPEPSLPEMDLEIPSLNDNPAEESVIKTESVEEKKKVNDIPYFELGKVQLVDAHIKCGLTQEDIDWVNEHHQGFTITRRKKPMINNTKDVEMDKGKQAKAPGVRVSARGRIYPEGRSNRSDKGNAGL